MDWRELERERVASGVVIYYTSWRCSHSRRAPVELKFVTNGDRAPGGNGWMKQWNLMREARSEHNHLP